MKLAKATHVITSIAANSNQAALPPSSGSLKPPEPGHRVLEDNAYAEADARRDRARAALKTLRSKRPPPSLHPALRGSGAVGGRRRLGPCVIAFAVGFMGAASFYLTGCLGGTLGVLKCPSVDRRLVRLLEGDGGEGAQVLVDTMVQAFDELGDEDQLRTLECDAEVFETMSAEEQERLVDAEARVVADIAVDGSPVGELLARVGGDNLFGAGPWTDEELAAAGKIEELAAGRFDGRRALSSAVDPDAVQSMKDAIVNFTEAWDGMDETERAEMASGVVEGVELYADGVRV